MTGCLLALAAFTLQLASRPGADALREGADFPVVMGHDVQGEPRSTDLRGEPSLVVIITDRGAVGHARAWWNAAETRLPHGVQRLSIASIGVPFFVSTDLARREARKNVPREHWHDTLLDTHHDLARELGLEPSNLPWVFVLDPSGRIVALVHTHVDSPDAARIWDELGIVVEAARR